ncbi:MAG: hypothetical protein QMD92_08500, partial [bacterium]|nr:hypothetical protein [bacterium]
MQGVIKLLSRKVGEFVLNKDGVKVKTKRQELKDYIDEINTVGINVIEGTHEEGVINSYVRNIKITDECPGCFRQLMFRKNYRIE